MKIRDIEAYFQTLYPKERSCPWDHDGLQVCCDRDRQVNRVLTCLDVTFSAIEKAASEGCQLMISHHPLIFSPMFSVNEDSLVGQKIVLLMQSGISLLSLHTRFDGAVGGLNDRFGEKMGLVPMYHEPLLPEEPFIAKLGSLPAKMSPEAFAERVSRALSAPVKLYSAGIDIEEVGFCCGAGKDLIHPCLQAGVDAFVGGDLSYHYVQEAVERGMTVIDCGHYASEKDAVCCFRDALLSFSSEIEVVPFLESYGGVNVEFSQHFCSNSTT